MPELAEVAFYRRLWARAEGEAIQRVHLNPRVRDFREVDPEQLRQRLEGARLLASADQAKQMLFSFSGGIWLGVHLGMAGRLQLGTAETIPEKHDHLVLYTARQALVFNDYRQFGKLLMHEGEGPPDWWTALAPPLLSDDFTREALVAFLQRRKASPLKAVLLMQERFPGIGNWMADEILWRARIRPDCLAGRVSGRKLSELYQSIRGVVADALREVAERPTERGATELDPRLPEDWLFNHRWRDGGHCPQTGEPLRRERIGGRTTCWSPAWQGWPA